VSRALVEAAASRLRAAGLALRARPRGEVLDEVGAVFDAWRDPRGRWQRELTRRLAAETGFSEANIAAGLALGLHAWNADALRALHACELGDPGKASGAAAGRLAEGFPLTSVVLAGAIPMPSLLQLLLPLCVQSPVLAKAASRDRATPALLVESLRALAPQLASSLEVVDFDRRDEAAVAAFSAAPCVVASGTDETIEQLRAHTTPSQRFVGYGHRVSIAVLSADALDESTARALAFDASLWDQLGCLSPVAIYAVGAQDAQLERFAARLAQAFEERERDAPRGAVGAEIAALIHREREEARFRSASRGRGAVHAPGQNSLWTVVLEGDAETREAPLHRFLRVHPVDDAASLERVIAPVARHLSCVALAGFGAGEEAISERLIAAGASRVCTPGQMQAPPLDWPHDGQPVLLPLVRLGAAVSARG
jgi:hypothetical protein